MSSPEIHATVRHSNDWRAEPDPIAVDEAIHGRRPRLYPSEMSQVVARLTDQGWSAARIAEHVGTTNRAVVRHRAHLRKGVTT